MARFVWRLVKFVLLVIVLAIVALLAPVGYVELACHRDISIPGHGPLIKDPAFQRAQANTYLTYPEWHIVYAYDGLAEVLKTGDEYRFDYVDSVTGFWTSTCAMMEAADANGGADGSTRTMIHTIGVSFTLEMALKAAYEETIGRVTAWWRGPVKTPQDEVVASMAADYAAFLRQTPWYKYDFGRQLARLEATPVTGPVRSRERQYAIGLEWRAKIAYAGAIAKAVEATGQAQLTIRTIVTGVDRSTLESIPDVTIIAEHPEGIEIETPRYARLTEILTVLAAKGAQIVDMAGNDRIMVSVIVPRESQGEGLPATTLMRLPRTGFSDDRLLLDVKLSDLAAILNDQGKPDGYQVEHVFDY